MRKFDLRWPSLFGMTHPKNLIIYFLVFFLVSSCEDIVPPDPEPEVDTANMSFYHASPDVGNVDVRINGIAIRENGLSYTNFTGYLVSEFALVDIVISPVGETDTLEYKNFRFSKDGFYSFYIAGTKNDLELIRIEDLPTGDNLSEKGAVRFVNLSADKPVLSMGTSDAVAPLFVNQNFGEVTDFISANSGSVIFELTLENETEPLASSFSEVIASGVYYTVIAHGYANPPTENDQELTIDYIIN